MQYYCNNSISKVKQQISFIGNLDQARNATAVFIIEEAKETMIDFSKRTVRVL